MATDRHILVSATGRVRAVPPAPGARYWRLTVLDPTCCYRVRQTSGGTSRQSALLRMRDLERQLAAHSPAGARATQGDELLDHYLSDSRPKNLDHPDRAPGWSLTYTDQVRHLVNHYLRPVLGRVPLRSWGAEHAYLVLDAAPTNYMVTKVRRTLSAVLGVGVADGFLRTDQLALHRVTVPLRPECRPARSAPVRQADVATVLLPGEVPSGSQIASLATAAPPGTSAERWEAIVNALAYGGFRIGELFALAADDLLHPAARVPGLEDPGRGNRVAAPPGDAAPTGPAASHAAIRAGLVMVRWQVIEPDGGPKRLAPPKNGFARLVALCERAPTGFPLRDWFHARAREAATERAAGHNPHATLFPTPRGLWWGYGNFRTRCFNPAATAAGWERVEWRGPLRRRRNHRWTTTMTVRRDWRHPIHSLRHHYACIARDLWGWTAAELCLNGGWADEAFVHARYYGNTAEAYATALAKQTPQLWDGTPG
jgi:hypothetical protein